MSISIIDIESYCRVCLHENETNLSIFDEVQEFNMSISDLLAFYGEMTVLTAQTNVVSIISASQLLSTSRWTIRIFIRK